MKPFPCFTCNISFNCYKKLTDHLGQHYPAMSISVGNPPLQKHWKLDLVKKESPEKTFERKPKKCRKCFVETDNLVKDKICQMCYLAKLQSRTKPGGQNVWKCQKCRKTYPSIAKLKMHKNECSKFGRAITCQVCSRKMVNAKTLERHQEVMHYKSCCSLCNSKFMTEFGLQLHIQNTHFTCLNCKRYSPDGLNDNLCGNCSPKPYSKNSALNATQNDAN